jgi:hypothetical protein
MTEMKQPEGFGGIIVALVSMFVVCILGLVAHDVNRYTSGIVMVDNNYVHYVYNNYSGDLSYNVGNNPTQTQVQLCRVYQNNYARCMKGPSIIMGRPPMRVAGEVSLTPASAYDLLVLEKLYGDGILNQKPYSINYLSETEEP